MITKPYLRRGDVLNLLEGEGVSRASARQMIEDKTIRPFYLPGQTWAYYSRQQIQRDVLDKLNPSAFSFATTAAGPAGKREDGPASSQDRKQAP